jgi:hypothetical protein
VSATVACDLKRTRHHGHRTESQPSTRVLPTAEEGLAEISEILAAGLMRLRARKSSELLHGGAGFFLGSLARQSGGVAEIEGDTP